MLVSLPNFFFLPLTHNAKHELFWAGNLRAGPRQPFRDQGAVTSSRHFPVAFDKTRALRHDEAQSGKDRRGTHLQKAHRNKRQPTFKTLATAATLTFPSSLFLPLLVSPGILVNQETAHKHVTSSLVYFTGHCSNLQYEY